ncbi:MAG: serine hydrolase [Lewinellaceae bacterium]|nr:serine hydrolase [Lewinellaceae bacterium]
MKQILIASLMLVACTTSWAQQAIDLRSFSKDQLETAVDSYVQDYLDLDVFSGVVLIADKGVPVYQKAFGLADREHNIPNTLDTKFIIGSMNKSFTHAVIWQLIDEGKLRPNDKMVQYLDGFPQPDAGKITVQHLLDHRSGFGDYNNMAFFELPYEQKNIATITNIAREMPLLFSPGTESEYSNTGYVLLGAIIEKVTGKSFADNVAERIVKPLGLKETYVSDARDVPLRSIGYLKTIQGTADNLYFLMEPKPDGGFWASATDVLAFYRHYFYGDQMISPATRKADRFFQMIAKAYDTPGAGIPIAGGSNGNNTIQIEYPHDSISIVVMANMDEPVAEKLAEGIGKILKHQTPEPAALPAVLLAYNLYQEKGAAYLKAHFEEITQNFFPGDPQDLILNNLGYDLLSSGQTDQAIAIFQLNTEIFPDVANCWDSLGEALLKNGDKPAALDAYKKALSIRPDLPTAKQAVRDLEKG